MQVPDQQASSGKRGKADALPRPGAAPGLGGRVLSNISWLSAGSLLTAGQTLLIGVLMARHFGPERFGLYAFAMGVAQLALPVAALGLPVVLTRELAARRHRLLDAALSEGVLIGSVLALRLAGGAVVWLGVALWAWGMYGDEPEKRAFLWLASALLLPQTLWILERWFVVRMASGIAVWSRAAVSLPLLALRLLLLMLDGPLIGFVWLAIGQACAEGLVLLLACRKQGGRPETWRVTVGEMGRLARQAWPLMIAGLAAGLFARVDQVLLEFFHGPGAVAYFVTALMLVEGPNFIPMAMAMSILPLLVSLRGTRPQDYPRGVQRFFDLMLWSSVSMAVFLGACGPWGLRWLFGPAYAESEVLMRILPPSLVGFSMMVAMNNYLMVEGAARIVGFAGVAACVLNLFLNLWWIPLYGPSGAAWAGAVTWMAIAFVLPVFSRAGRRSVHHAWWAWTAPGRWLLAGLWLAWRR